ncbi:Aste57867_22436 [Aphanomyces stellatus]|uniref:Aste57867_22436 protein n=1 Tax=Aphanomyces stellatus TaxID=120398 RepID=A0A485LPZ8_9STRA|nr:hypothetical protein As57867_022366 [Aphanomyces stellatus]VFT99098.1 Aste57867_22436 [Aphanomyces stellatus]
MIRCVQALTKPQSKSKMAAWISPGYALLERAFHPWGSAQDVLFASGNAVGHFTKYKARLVIKGFMQRYGLDYVEIFAPVLRYNTLRLVLFLVASNGWIIRQMDVKTAFLNGYLDEDTEIFMVQPPNFAVPGMEHLVCKLLEAIYGLKQAPRCWYLTLHEFLVSISFERCIKEVCLYIKRVGDSMVLLTVYVDDITITGNDNQEIEKACDSLKLRFKMTDLGQGRDNVSTRLCLKSLREVQHGHPVSTPEVVGQVLEPSKLNPSEMKTLNLPYRELVGSLQNLVTCTRPDIANAVRSLSKYLSCFDESHWKQAKRVLRSTAPIALFKIDCTNQVGAFQVEAYCDADFANSEDRRSISGFLVMFLGCCLSARSRKQTMVTLSTAEAEYIALCDLVKELLWYIELLEELGFPQRSIVVHCDNQSAIAIAKNPGHDERTKHISTKYHFVRDQVEKGRIQLQYCPTKLIVADILTKAIPREQFEILRSKMGLADGPTN